MRIALALVALALATPGLAKDLVVLQRSETGVPGTQPRDETVYFAGNKVVNDSATARTIVDLNTQTITAADKTKRTYHIVTFDELAAQMDALRKEVDRMPPEAKKMMGGLFEEGPPVAVKPTGKKAKIAGYEASEYSLKGGPYDGAVWTTEAIPKPPQFQRWQSIEQSAGASRGPGRQLGAAMAQLPGFPLRTRIETKAGGQTFLVSNEVVEVKEGSPPADVLAIPPGYTLQPLPGPGN